MAAELVHCIICNFPIYYYIFIWKWHFCFFLSFSYDYRVLKNHINHKMQTLEILESFESDPK
jgi:hypothetical protein